MNYYQMVAEAINGPKTGYAWIITKDHTAGPGERDDAGTIGPRTATDEDEARLRKGKGKAFKMYDDDGELYYSGRLVVSGDMDYDDEDAMFGPLDDFGAPNAGATEIRWAEAGGKWVTA